MDREELFNRQNEILSCLSSLPQKMLSLYGRENVSEFVLHDLCQEKCFNLQRAAYFVNNPDFNFLKGIAGISRKDIPQSLWNDIWSQSEMFSTYMRNAPFNRDVRKLSHCCFEVAGASDEKVVDCIAKKLHINNHSYVSLPMKHNNHGLFIYEKNNDHVAVGDVCFINGISLLGFCPVF